MEDFAAANGAEHAEKCEYVEDPFQTPLVPGEEDRGVEHTAMEDIEDDDDEKEDGVDNLVEDEEMEDNVIKGVDDVDKADALEERDDDVERVVGGNEIRRALPNWKKTDRAATR